MKILKQILQNLMSINCDEKKTPNLMSINCEDIKTNTPKSYEYKL
jgi:hypothetical protein